LEALLHHEAGHIVFGHLTHTDEDYPDTDARIASEETTVNEWIREPLPPTPVTLADFPALPANEMTRQRYERLCKIPKKQWRCLSTSDDHSRWEEIEDPDQIRRAIQRLIVLAVTSTGIARIPIELQKAVRAAIGVAPGTDLTTIFGTGRGKVDWRQQLRRYVGRMLDREPSYQRPDRRLPKLLGIVPGKASQSSKPKVLAAIDTSGSISDAQLEDFDAELARLNRRYEVTVVECDAKIQAVYRYQPVKKPNQGRGGTDFRLVFEPEFLRQQRPDVLVYLTDGFGQPPEQRPRVPTVWVLTLHGKRPVPWGHEIRLS
jgi:predicted metal-dependent peptidase